MLKKLIPLVTLLLLLTACEVDSETAEQQAVLQKAKDEVTTTFLPDYLSAEEINFSDDKSVIQIIANEYYDDINIPNLIQFLETKKADKLLTDFDVDTYQTGFKLSDDQVVVIIQK